MNVVFSKVKTSVTKTVKLPFCDKSLIERLIVEAFIVQLFCEYDPKTPFNVWFPDALNNKLACRLSY